MDHFGRDQREHERRLQGGPEGVLRDA